MKWTVTASLLGLALTPTQTSSFAPSNRKGTSLPPSSSSSQVLTFTEPTTNVQVTLIGAMHYNPQSIRLASSTCEELVQRNALASVIVESCPTRWSKTLRTQPEGSVMRQLFDNEMQAAAEVAARAGLPVVLGDQDISATNKRMAQTFQASVVDLLTPWRGGWAALYTDIAEAARLTLPSGNQYLGADAFFNGGLLLAAPVSLVRYPLSFIVKSPLFGVPAIGGLVYALLNTGDTSFVGTTAVEQLQEVVTSATIFGVETAVFARVFLVALLAERNEILANNILAECRRAAAAAAVASKGKGMGGGKGGGLLQMISAGLSGSAAKGDDSGRASAPVVVAVLGAAHVNGIRLLLETQAKGQE